MNRVPPTGRRVLLWAGATAVFLLASSLLPARQPKGTIKLPADSAPVSLAFSPDGKALASAAIGHAERPRETRLWDVATGKNTVTFQGNTGMVFSVAFSPDGKSLASGGGRFPDENGLGAGEVKLWDVATGKNAATLKGHPGMVFSVAFSPDGKRLASASVDGTVRTWEVATGKCTATFKALPEDGDRGAIMCVTFSPDGKTLAVGGGPVKRPDGQGVTGEVQLWDLATGKKTATLHGHPGEGCFSNMFAIAFSVAFRPDGKALVSGGARTIEVWDVATGKRTATYTRASVYRMALSPDGKTVAWVTEPMSDELAEKTGWDRSVRLLDLTTGKDLPPLKGPAANGYALAFRPDGKVLAYGGMDSKILVCALPQGPKARRGR